MTRIKKHVPTKTPASTQAKPPTTNAPKEGEVIPPSSGRLTISDMVAIAQEATAFMREAAGFLTEREKTKQALITSQDKFESVRSEIERARMEHIKEMTSLDQAGKDADAIIAQLSDLREAVRPLLSDLATLGPDTFQRLMEMLRMIDTFIGRLRGPDRG